MQSCYLSVPHNNSWSCWTTSYKFDGEIETSKTLISMKMDGLFNKNLQNNGYAEGKGCSISNAHAVIHKVPLLTAVLSLLLFCFHP